MWKSNVVVSLSDMVRVQKHFHKKARKTFLYEKLHCSSANIVSTLLFLQT